MARNRKPLPRAPRGGGRIFFDDPAVDRVLAVVLTLASDVWALRERFAVIESLAARRGLPLDIEVETYEFTPEQEASLAQLRNDFIGNLFRTLNEPAANAAPTRKADRKTSKRARRPK